MSSISSTSSSQYTQSSAALTAAPASLPPDARTVQGSQSQSLQVNEATESLANSVFAGSSTVGTSAPLGTFQSYAIYMDLPPAKVQSVSQASAYIKLTEVTNQLAEEINSSSANLMKSMGDVAATLAEAANKKAIENSANVAEQAAKQQKQKVWGWIAKAAQLAIGAALIATGVGAGLGAMMIATVAVGMIEKSPAVSKFLENHPAAKVAIIAAMAVGNLACGNVAMAVGTVMTQTMTEFGPQISKALENAGWSPKAIEAFTIGISLTGALISAAGGYSAAKGVAAAAQSSSTLATAASTTTTVAAVAQGASTIASSSYQIEIAKLQETFAKNDVLINLINKTVQNSQQECAKLSSELSKCVSDWNNSIVATATRMQAQNSDVQMRVATRC